MSFYVFMGSEEIRIVDPQGPWEHVGSQFTFLYCPYKLPTPLFRNPWFASQSFNKMTLLFHACSHLSLFLFSRLQAWKLWFRGHIKKYRWIVMITLFSMLIAFPIFLSLHNWQGSKILYSFGISVVNMISIFMRLWWFVKECDPIVDLLVAWCLIEFVSIGGLISIVFDRFPWNIVFMKIHWCCG